MSSQSKLVREHFFEARNIGQLAAPCYTGQAASTRCGATIRISIKVDDSRTITQAKFKAAGCDLLVASASFLTEGIIGEKTGEVASLARASEMPFFDLLELTEPERRCARLSTEALLFALMQYSDSARDEWEGEEALICTCFCVSERQIEAEILRGDLQTVAEVTKSCNAGGGCRSCWPLIEDMLSVTNSGL